MTDLPASRYQLPCVDENLEMQARERPGHCAIIYYGARLDYAWLNDQVEKLARALHHGFRVRPGERVAVAMQNSPHYVIAYYAILRAGGVVVPLNPMYRNEEVRRILEDAGTKIALVGSELVDRFQPGDADKAGPACEVIVAHYGDLLPEEPAATPPAVGTAPRPHSLPAKFSDWREVMGEHHAALPPANRSTDDLCVMPYTSGSTAMPKGCVHRHSAVQHTAALQAESYEITTQSVVSAVQPLYHVAGMQGSMNAAILAGATLLIMTRWDAAAAIQLFSRFGVTFWNAPPTMVIDMLSQADFDPAAFARLKVITGGGSSMPPAVAEQLQKRFGLPYVEGYGMSETMSPTHLNPIAAPRSGSIGVVVQDTESIIVDSETLAPVPDGQIGEIWVRGPQLMLRYWNNEAATRETLVKLDGKTWLRTGDIGRRDREGYFYITDRLKRMINASGFKVSPAEVEQLLFGHEAVRQVCVIAAADGYRGETVKALIVPNPAFRGHISAQEIIDWARARIAAYKAPRIVEFVEDLPLTPSHKVDWRRLQDAERAAPPAG